MASVLGTSTTSCLSQSSMGAAVESSVVRAVGTVDQRPVEGV